MDDSTHALEVREALTNPRGNAAARRPVTPFHYWLCVSP